MVGRPDDDDDITTKTQNDNKKRKKKKIKKKRTDFNAVGSIHLGGILSYPIYCSFLYTVYS